MAASLQTNQLLFRQVTTLS